MTATRLTIRLPESLAAELRRRAGATPLADFARGLLAQAVGQEPPDMPQGFAATRDGAERQALSVQARAKNRKKAKRGKKLSV